MNAIEYETLGRIQVALRECLKAEAALEEARDIPYPRRKPYIKSARRSIQTADKTLGEALHRLEVTEAREQALD